MPCNVSVRGAFQLTPSARRATKKPLSVVYLGCISIHALREESDQDGLDRLCCRSYFNPRPPRGERHPAWYPAESPAEFQSTPSARRATSLRETTTALMQRFQSTPSVGRATNIWAAAGTTSTYFNPRPPRGGRLHRLLCTVMPWKFQSTPSARRATRRSCRLPTRKRQFQSTPSARRATS